uniref:F-box domain-containing protein n=1 Tax=Oryza rufipogon TaxID=4529 RepID=A0A0E0P0M4_ORYRU
MLLCTDACGQAMKSLHFLVASAPGHCCSTSYAIKLEVSGSGNQVLPSLTSQALRFGQGQWRPRVPPSTTDIVSSNKSVPMTKPEALQLHHLPDDVLHRILSRLTFRESSRMGLLSRKWQKLWRSCCPKLIFTRATMFKPGNKTIRRTRTNFARRVNSLLRQLCAPPTLNKFVVKFGLRRKHTCHVNRWVGFCSKLRARHITFDFTPGVKGIFRGLADEKYIFHLHVFSVPDRSPAHIKSLHLSYVWLNTATTGFTGFANLKKLTLHKVSFLNDFQHLMLSECTALEWLSISCSSFTELTLCKPLRRLRYLSLHYCYMEKVELEAPNLTSVDLTNRPIPLALSESLKVMEANIKLLHKSVLYGDNLDYICTELPAALPHVQKLSITSTLCIYDELQSFAKTSVRFINLRHLSLYLPLYGDGRSVGGILRLAYLLELAPVLEELELHFRFSDFVIRQAIRVDMLPYRHDKLKRVVMSGACHWQGLIELAHHIRRCASRLDFMIMDPMVRIKGLPTVDWLEERGRRIAKELLKRQEFQGVLTVL